MTQSKTEPQDNAAALKSKAIGEMTGAELKALLASLQIDRYEEQISVYVEVPPLAKADHYGRPTTTRHPPNGALDNALQSGYQVDQVHRLHAPMEGGALGDVLLFILKRSAPVAHLVNAAKAAQEAMRGTQFDLGNCRRELQSEKERADGLAALIERQKESIKEEQRERDAAIKRLSRGESVLGRYRDAFLKLEAEVGKVRARELIPESQYPKG